MLSLRVTVALDCVVEPGTGSVVGVCLLFGVIASLPPPGKEGPGLFALPVGDGGTGVFLVTVTVMALLLPLRNPEFAAEVDDACGGARDSVGKVPTFGSGEPVPV